MQSLAHYRFLARQLSSRVAVLVWASCAACVDVGGFAALHSRETAAALKPAPLAASPGEDWRRAAGAEDWSRLAQTIDQLPEETRSTPGARYARAVAAARLGEPARALPLLEGLEGLLPALRPELDELRASCQLEIGPFEPAARYYASQSSPRAWLKSALAWQRAGRSSQALREVGRVLATRNLQRATRVGARQLRAELAEHTGATTVARRDYYWLAVTEAIPDADIAYERLARTELTKSERLLRALELAQRGRVDAVDSELARLRSAPGRTPPRSELLRCQALARYRGGDYGLAAALYEQAARLPGPYRVSDRFLAAEAWSRVRQIGRAGDIYREIARRHPRSAARADFLRARLHYGRGEWRTAELAYTQYLSRHRPGNARRAVAARYERALSRLAAGQVELARRDFADLRRRGTDHASASLLRHLEAVAALSSDDVALQSHAIAELEAIVRDQPLSFAAQASSARLARIGRPAPMAPRRPLAEQLATAAPELPDKAKLLAQLGLFSAAEAALHAEQPHLLRRYAPHGGQALCRQYRSLKRGFRGYQLARSVLRRGTLDSLPTSSSLWAWQCLYPLPFPAAVADLEAHYELPPGLLHSVMRQESEFRADVRSRAGAVGLMQLMPGTARRVAEELGLPLEPQQLLQAAHNLRLGAHYLRKLLSTFDEQPVLALASYNAGPHAVERWLEGADSLEADIWVARIPYRETRNYVQRVMANWARYRYLARRPAPVHPIHLQLPRDLQLPDGLY